MHQALRIRLEMGRDREEIHRLTKRVKELEVNIRPWVFAKVEEKKRPCFIAAQISLVT